MKKRIYFVVSTVLLTVTGIWSGCMKEDNTEYPNVNVDTLTVQGIMKYRQTSDAVVAWPYGTAKIGLLSGGIVLATGTVNPSGFFSLILPSAVSGKHFIAISSISDAQGGNLTATPNTVRVMVNGVFVVEYLDGEATKTIYASLHTMNAEMIVNKSYCYNLYDSDGTFAGTSSKGSVYNWNFSKGWGLTEVIYSDASPSAFTSQTVQAAPAEAFWSN